MEQTGAVASEPIHILSTATAVPQHKITQNEARAQAKAYFNHLGYMEAVFANSGIESRHSCVPVAWYLRDHDWKERADLFLCHGLDLLERAAHSALARARVEPEEVSAIVTVTSTGIAIPSLDARIANRLGLPANVERLPIFGLGCAGGAGGLAKAARLAATLPGPVLLLVIELCGINFRLRDLTKTNFVTTALFGDGAAAIVLGTDSGARSKARIVASGEHMWPDTEDVMGFTVEADGLGVQLRPDVPRFTRENLRAVTEAFLERYTHRLESFAGFLFHPGGAKVLEAIEAALGLMPPALDHSRAVLNEYGNMSSATVLFVLHRALEAGDRGRHLMGAFGPGFSANLVILELGPCSATHKSLS